MTKRQTTRSVVEKSLVNLSKKVLDAIDNGKSVELTPIMAFGNSHHVVYMKNKDLVYIIRIEDGHKRKLT